MGRLKIRTSTCDIERMQVFCAQMHVFTPSGVGANVNTKKCSFFHQTVLLSAPLHTGILYKTVYSSTNTGVSSLLQMNRKVELVGQA